MSKTRIAGAAAAAVLLATGCGSDDGDDNAAQAPKPTKLSLELSGAGKSVELTAPKTVKGGLVTVELTNSAQAEGGAQLVRIEGDHTGEEALKAGSAWGESGKPLPAWVKLAGGVGSAKPGKTASATQELTPGKYVAADLESNASTEFTVTAGEGAAPPARPAAIDAVEYRFTTRGLKAGAQDVTFANKGGQPHFVAATSIRPGKSIDDVKQFIQSEKGEPPIDESSGFDTAVMDGGQSQSVRLELKKGRYALLCFVPDRQGGPPHVAKGMVSEVEIP